MIILFHCNDSVSASKHFFVFEAPPLILSYSLCHNTWRTFAHLWDCRVVFTVFYRCSNDCTFWALSLWLASGRDRQIPLRNQRGWRKGWLFWSPCSSAPWVSEHIELPVWGSVPLALLLQGVSGSFPSAAHLLRGVRSFPDPAMAAGGQQAAAESRGPGPARLLRAHRAGGESCPGEPFRLRHTKARLPKWREGCPFPPGICAASLWKNEQKVGRELIFPADFRFL